MARLARIGRHWACTDGAQLASAIVPAAGRPMACNGTWRRVLEHTLDRPLDKCYSNRQAGTCVACTTCYLEDPTEHMGRVQRFRSDPVFGTILGPNLNSVSVSVNLGHGSVRS